MINQRDEWPGVGQDQALPLFEHHLCDFFASGCGQVPITTFPASDVILYLIVEAFEGIFVERPHVFFESGSHHL
jgi:hypothetical protein